MEYSLAEIDAVSKKAARGMGFSWGLSEEAGKAARYLASLVLPGPQVLVSYLDQLDGAAITTAAPDISSSTWQAADAYLCPLATGASLSDLVSVFEQQNSIQLKCCAAPLLLPGIVVRVTPGLDDALVFEWDDVRVTVQNDCFTIDGNSSDLLTLLAEQVTVSRIERAEPVTQPIVTSVEVDDRSWARLNELAFRTYVPSSEASRAGAGSSLSDND